MALLTADLFSEALEVGTSITVVLPQSTQTQIGVAAVDVPDHGWPVLYLLHGLSDDHTAWVRYTSIERYATAAGLAVVMPAAGRSFYADEAHGHRYWTWISAELPQRVGEMFRLSARPGDTYVAGLSMGGYGALKLALTHPERYAGAASLSGAVDVRSLTERPERRELLTRVFDGTVGADDDIFELLDRADVSTVPPLYLGCGTEEVELLAANTRLATAARDAGIEVTTDFRPGVHEWGLWDATIRDVIAWLPRG
ncbi:alpha/beta hydrolase [Nocardioides coralli]|uniref:alpha/beta hydrolase n=1 Tax=Nocardioides coralli TaxID=2872154 RepID=UPI001CA45A5C|nr:alpha/beta hydrolase family protein [Nocardioides coralli]QZY28381.1 esterase family protein [Nocardioides coralli]